MTFAKSKEREVVSQYDLEKTIRHLRTERNIPKGSDQLSPADGERADNDLSSSNNEAEDADALEFTLGDEVLPTYPSNEPRSQDRQSVSDAQDSNVESLPRPGRIPLPTYNLGGNAHPFPVSARQRRIFLPPGNGPFYFENDPTAYFPDGNRRPVPQAGQPAGYSTHSR